jgi:hypothetical protein
MDHAPTPLLVRGAEYTTLVMPLLVPPAMQYMLPFAVTQGWSDMLVGYEVV